MNCCKHEQDEHKEHQNHKGGHGSHMWMMLLCCGLPLLVFAALPFIDRVLPGSANSIRWIVPFLCPLMMLPMMLSGMREKHDDGPETKLQTQNQEDSKTDAGSCH